MAHIPVKPASKGLPTWLWVALALVVLAAAAVALLLLRGEADPALLLPIAV